MAETDNLDPYRLPGRARRQSGHTHPGPEADEEIEADDEIEAVTKLMGFLRQEDEG
jgi:hypothetical protein